MKRDSYPPLLIAYIRKGRFRVEYRGEFNVAEAGDILLLDCIEPHYYHAEDGLEFVYMHFEGSNARELCRRITDRHGWLIRRDNNTLIGNLLYDMVRFYDENGVETDMQRSARIYRMFDLLLSPSAAEQSADTPVEQAIQYIRSHIGQPISVEELARLGGGFHYELICDLGKRVPRVYLRGGRIAGTKDYFQDVYEGFRRP